MVATIQPPPPTETSPMDSGNPNSSQHILGVSPASSQATITEPEEADDDAKAQGIMDAMNQILNQPVELSQHLPNSATVNGSAFENDNPESPSGDLDALAAAADVVRQQDQPPPVPPRRKWTYVPVSRKIINLPLKDNPHNNLPAQLDPWDSLTSKWQGTRPVVDFNPARWDLPKHFRSKAAHEQSSVMFCNCGLEYPPLEYKKEADFMLGITPIHFAQAVFGDQQIGLQHSIDNYSEETFVHGGITKDTQWEAMKRKMAQDAIDLMIAELYDKCCWTAKCPVQGTVINGFIFKTLEKKTGDRCFPFFCTHCLDAGVHPASALLCWASIVHIFPREYRAPGSLNQRMRHGPVKSYIRPEMLFPHPALCPNANRNPAVQLLRLDPRSVLAREEYINLPFPIQHVVGHSMDDLWHNLVLEKWSDPKTGLPEMKGVERITTGLIDYKNVPADDRCYIELPVREGPSFSNARELLGNSLNKDNFPPLYLRWVFQYMIRVGVVQEMCPFVATWPNLVPDTGDPKKNKQIKESWAPQWTNNPKMHLVLRQPSVLIGGMYKGDRPLDTNRVKCQPLHRDDTNAYEEGLDPTSPFYKGPDFTSALSRTTSCIATLFAKEKRSLAIKHPANRKDIFHGEIGIFDGATLHAGWTCHPDEVIVLEKGIDGQEQKRRVYNCALHGHIDSMVSRVARVDGYLENSNLFEEDGIYEPPEHALQQEKVDRCIKSYRRKEEELARAVDHVLHDPAQRIMSSQVTPGVFNARVIAQSVCCTSTTDAELGSDHLPAIPRGTKTCPAVMAMAIGMLNIAAVQTYGTNEDGRVACKEAAKSLTQIYDDFRNNQGKRLVNAKHARYEPDEEEERRSKRAKKNHD